MREACLPTGRPACPHGPPKFGTITIITGFKRRKLLRFLPFHFEKELKELKLVRSPQLLNFERDPGYGAKKSKRKVKIEERSERFHLAYGCSPPPLLGTNFVWRCNSCTSRDIAPFWTWIHWDTCTWYIRPRATSSLPKVGEEDELDKEGLHTKKIRKQTKLSACKNGFPFPVHRKKFSPLA